MTQRTLATIAGLSLAAQLAFGKTGTDADFGAQTVFDTAAGNLAVYQVGTGPKTLIYWPSVLADHTMYRAQASAMGSQYRQVFIDGPGHGGSGAQPAGATLDTHAQAALQIMDQLGIRQATFIGTSWGGLVGARLAHDHPQRVLGLLALNTPFETKAGGPAFGDRMTVWAAGMFGNRDFFATGASKAFFSKSSQEKHPEYIQAFAARFSAFDRSALAPVLRTVLLERQNALPWLREIRVPTVIVAGADDPVITQAQARHAADLIPGARLTVAEGVGHLSPIEAASTINAEIEALTR